VFALLGYATLAAHIHTGIAETCMWVALALLAHQMAGDLLDAVAAPDMPTGRWVRERFGLAPTSSCAATTSRCCCSISSS
jgi:hypothetical protein